jgi:hypothetical protein
MTINFTAKIVETSYPLIAEENDTILDLKKKLEVLANIDHRIQKWICKFIFPFKYTLMSINIAT